MSSVAGLLHFVRGQQAAFEHARSLYAERLAPSFNPFQFISTDELGLSRVIGWMLDPTASHGQSDRFLAALVRHLSLPWDQITCKQAKVRLEAPTSHLDAARRIDLLVQSGGRALAIENKPYAADQPNQVADYFRHLDAAFPAGHCLIYLSAKGEGPTSDSISAQAADKRRADGNLIVMAYDGLLPWIADCRAQCRADRVSIFLDEFAAFIQQRFQGIRDMQARDQLVAEIADSGALVAPAFQVILAADRLRETLMARMEADLRAHATAEGWTTTARQDVPSGGFSLRFTPGQDLWFSIGFGNVRKTGFAYGVTGIGMQHPDYLRIHNLLSKELGAGEQWDNWPWGTLSSASDANVPCDTDWSTSERPWVAIADGSLVKALVRTAKRIEAALSREGLLASGSSATLAT